MNLDNMQSSSSAISSKSTSYNVQFALSLSQIVKSLTLLVKGFMPRGFMRHGEKDFVGRGGDFMGMGALVDFPEEGIP